MKDLFLAAAIAGITIAMPATASADEIIVKQGQFVDGDVGDHGSGNAIIADDGDKTVLRLTDFSTTPGPDLKVILVEAEGVTKTAEVKASKWVSLGPLQSPTGDQDYAIPDGVPLNQYHSVAIWCESYSVLFAAAALN